MVSAVCLINGLAPPQNVAASSTVTVALQDSAGVASWSLTCTSTDELNTIGAVNATIVIDNVHFTATFTMPSTATGSAVQITSSVNGDPSTAVKFGVFVLGPMSNRLLFPGETSESSAQFGVVADLNAVGRVSPGSAPPATAVSPGTIYLAGDLGGLYTSPIVEKINGTTIPAPSSANAILTGTGATTSAWQQTINVSGTIATSSSVTGNTVVSTTSVTAADFVSNAAHPAASGTLRDGNNTTIIAARDAANDADLSVLKTGSDNSVTVGNTTKSDLNLNAKTITTMNIDGYQVANTGTTFGPLLFNIIAGLTLNPTGISNANSPYTIDSGVILGSGYTDTIIFVDCSGGSVILNAPNPNLAGRFLLVVDYKGSSGTHTIQVNRYGSGTISGSTAKQITTNYGMMLLIADGTNWNAASLTPP